MDTINTLSGRVSALPNIHIKKNDIDKKVEKQDVPLQPSLKSEGEVYTSGIKDSAQEPLSKQQKIKETFEQLGNHAKKITGNLPAVQNNMGGASEADSKSAVVDSTSASETQRNDSFSVHFMPKIEAVAEKEKPPLDRNKPVDIKGDSPEAHEKRVDLLRSTPQINKTSGPEGENMCGGASLASAMILDSGKTTPPDTGKKNAEAIRNVYGELYKDDKKKTKLTKEQDDALKHLADGKMSPKDVEHLQKVMYEITQKVNGQGQGGVNVDGMAEAVNMLRAKGGFAGGSDVKFHVNEGEGSRTGGKHWTTTVDGVHVDTWPVNYDPKNPGKDPGKAVVTGFPGAGDPPGIGKQSNGWTGDVSFSGDSNTSMEYMPPGGKKPLNVMFDKKDYEGKGAKEILTDNKTIKDIEKVQHFERTMSEWKEKEKNSPSDFEDWKSKSPDTYKKYEEWKKNNQE